MDKILYVTFSQVLVALLLIGFSSKHNRHNRYLKYFLFIGFCHLVLKLLITEFITDPFLANQYFVPFSFGYTPALFLFIFEVYHRSFVRRHWQILHFLPLFTAIVFYVTFGIFYQFRGLHPAMEWYAANGYYLLGAQITIYALLSVRLSWKGIFYREEASYVFKHTVAISGLFLLLGLMILVDMRYPALIGYNLAGPVAYFSLLTIFVLILHMQFNRRIEKIVKDVEEKSTASEQQRKYQNSGLSPEDKAHILATIKTHFRKTKPYLHPDFNLDRLAKQVALPKHHISQVLNEEVQQNFFQFVNSHRVQAVCDAFLQYKDREDPNVLEIAFRSGFKSKSSFNQNFKKITGMTPTAYLEKMKHQTGTLN